VHPEQFVPLFQVSDTYTTWAPVMGSPYVSSIVTLRSVAKGYSKKINHDPAASRKGKCIVSLNDASDERRWQRREDDLSGGLFLCVKVIERELGWLVP
jgi:hypothetical protein